MKDLLTFSVSGSNSVHELQVGQTLIRFAEFDFAYFKEQCISLFHKEEPEEFAVKASHLREYLHSCHPYCKALLDTDFEKVIYDCILEDICLTEGVGLEELWVKHLSADDPLGQTFFKRITEYKTGHAINQWANLVRMHAYAVAKMNFIYSGPETDAAVHKARRLYYDLIFAQTAAQLGYQSAEMPKTEISGAPYLPQAGAVMKTAANLIDPVIKNLTTGVAQRLALKGSECVRDQMAGVVFNVMAGLTRPSSDDVELMARKYGSLPGTIYRPSSLKAILDVEFDQMAERGFYIQADGVRYTRMKYSSKRELHDKQEQPETSQDIQKAIQEMTGEKRPRTKDKPEPKDKKLPERPDTQEKRLTSEKPSEASKAPQTQTIQEPKVSGKVKSIIELAEDPNRVPLRERTLQEVNTRCNLIWTSMNVQTGWSITAEDASEWFRYLTRLRYGINKGELTPAALDKFLDATLQVYKLLPGEE